MVGHAKRVGVKCHKRTISSTVNHRRGLFLLVRSRLRQSASTEVKKLHKLKDRVGGLKTKLTN